MLNSINLHINSYVNNVLILIIFHTIILYIEHNIKKFKKWWQFNEMKEKQKEYDTINLNKKYMHISPSDAIKNNLGWTTFIIKFSYNSKYNIITQPSKNNLKWGSKWKKKLYLSKSLKLNKKTNAYILPDWVASCKIQSMIRKYLIKKYIKKYKNYIIKIQAFIRGKIIRLYLKKYNKYIIKTQAIIRGKNIRKIYKINKNKKSLIKLTINSLLLSIYHLLYSFYYLFYSVCYLSHIIYKLFRMKYNIIHFYVFKNLYKFLQYLNISPKK